jgi:hypothetical protein
MKIPSNLFLLALAHFCLLLDDLVLGHWFLATLWIICLILDTIQLLNRGTIYKREHV